MVLLATNQAYDTPGAAREIGCSEDHLRRALLRRPDLAARVARLGGRRIIGADLIPELADEVKRVKPGRPRSGLEPARA